jgi:phage/conjugal plasmid C-4 type zinc finger TraR family protein
MPSGDEADRASEREEADRERAIAAVRARTAEGDWREISAIECADCGERIALARRRAIVGVRRCIDCARAAERRAAVGALG